MRLGDSTSKLEPVLEVGLDLSHCGGFSKEQGNWCFGSAGIMLKLLVHMPSWNRMRSYVEDNEPVCHLNTYLKVQALGVTRF